MYDLRASILPISHASHKSLAFRSLWGPEAEIKISYGIYLSKWKILKFGGANQILNKVYRFHCRLWGSRACKILSGSFPAQNLVQIFARYNIASGQSSKILSGVGTPSLRQLSGGPSWILRPLLRYIYYFFRTPQLREKLQLSAHVRVSWGPGLRLLSADMRRHKTLHDIYFLF